VQSAAFYQNEISADKIVQNMVSFMQLLHKTGRLGGFSGQSLRTGYVRKSFKQIYIFSHYLS
jgi:hypothetical protein